MTDSGKTYFSLSLEELRAIGGWAADCAERALPIYESQSGSDCRPAAAIEGIRQFAAGGRRTTQLRVLALAAHAAAREIGDPAAAAAARAAGSAAASAYTHPLSDVHQTKHVVGAAAYAALALELSNGGDDDVARTEVCRAIADAPAAARGVLAHMPARTRGRGRLAQIMFDLDDGLRTGQVHPRSD